MSNAKTIGEKLVALCKEGKNDVAIQELYSDDIVSVEAEAAPGMEREAKGRAAVVGKGQWWVENHEIHSANVQGPFPHGEDRFAVVFDYDVTFKPMSKRQKLHEVALYTIDGGKIVREEFFYNMGQ